jgi:hypothetical protein
MCICIKDCDDVHLKLGNLIEDYGPIVHSILTPSEPSTFENITTASDLDEEVEIAWKVLNVQFILN